MSDDELKRCPFCGSRKIGLNHISDWVIVCGACGAEGPSGGTAAGAEERWNHRYRGDRDEDKQQR